jgi:DNA topoisomerase-3
MKVIITEKPSVARDIAKVLKVTGKKEGYIEGNGYIITWALGHLIQLVNPDSYDKKYKSWAIKNLPIVPEAFKVEVIPNKGQKAQFKIIKSLITKPDIEEIICATDAGREGELIFRFIYDHAKAKAPIKRLWISSQTDKAIREGFDQLKPGDDYQPLYDSALSRAEADWLIGMNATRAYSSALSKGNGVMSVGRVQTPVLNMIVQRYESNRAFVPETFYEVFADIAHENGSFRAKWFKKKEDRFKEKEQAEEIVKAVSENPLGVISQLTEKQKKENPPQLYDLTELQKDANRRFKFSADRTLKTMQNLYEKHKVLTYPRTSSRYLSQDMVPKLPQLLQNLTEQENFKPHADAVLSKELPITKRIVDDTKVTDHHAIIPTDAKADVTAFSSDERRIYDLVIKRFLAAFLPVCLKNTTEIISTFSENTFKVSGTVIQSPGWRAVYSTENKEDKEATKDTTEKDTASDKKTVKNQKETLLPIVKKGDDVTAEKTTVVDGQTKPPALYNEASILAAMETAGKQVEDEALREAMKDCGLGTPATRSQILERLISVGYINRDNNTLTPTDKGIYLIENIQDKALLSPELTGEWEKKLNDMAQGKYLRNIYMEDIVVFTKQVVKQVKEASDSGNSDMAGQSPIGKCPKCKKEDIYESLKTFSCAASKEGECDFVVWKMIAGKVISKSAVMALINEGKTPLITGFRSKAGKLFDAMLEFKDGKVSFNFERDPVGKCPVCSDGDIIVTSKSFSCSNWKEKQCPFTIWKIIAGKAISEDLVKQLAGEGKTGLLSGFKSRAGKPFNAFLELEEGKAKLIFEEKE